MYIGRFYYEWSGRTTYFFQIQMTFKPSEINFNNCNKMYQNDVQSMKGDLFK
jgi:hypothetical protein